MKHEEQRKLDELNNYASTHARFFGEQETGMPRRTALLSFPCTTTTTLQSSSGGTSKKATGQPMCQGE